MSQLILQWLNDEIQLSKKVADLELEFANGFLFGELLNKYNQQLNFDEFSNKFQNILINIDSSGTPRSRTFNSFNPHSRPSRSSSTLKL